MRQRSSIAQAALQVVGCLLAGAAALAPGRASAQAVLGPRPAGPQEEILKTVRLEQRLGAEVPLDTRFVDETGKPVQLQDYFGVKPVMMVLIQYRCTMLCTEETRILVESLKQLKFTPGKEFNLLIVSIDPREKPDLATDKKAAFMKEYDRPEAAAGVHFLTGDDASIHRLSDAIGFFFKYDERTDQYAHPDGVLVATPQGRMARYFFKLDYAPQALRLGLVEAGGNKIGTPLDAIALLCFHYSPVTGKYGLALLGLVRLASIAMVVGMVLGLSLMRAREAHRRRSSGPALGTGA